ncbi:hypothetical protein QEZ47_25560 [Aminobacter anthyllidis]|uniref:hypothetical protein n=1 Tax=Aminobacter anthyllidis TaxID=1035067 RepID=UPI0024550351|nr:hypothetical protein [Aminobacter anthyllidis]MDH4988819.1 hypothetical protein [Aminobacter anthyllidis]
MSEEFGEQPPAAVWPGEDAKGRHLETGMFGQRSIVLYAAEITFGIALVLIVIGVSLLWSRGVIGKVMGVGLCVACLIAAMSLLPIRRRRRSRAGDGSGCGGGSSGDSGDGGGCGGGD